MPSLHHEPTLDRDLAELRRTLQGMASAVLEGLHAARRALRDRDRAAAYRVILADNRIDALEGTVDRMCQEFLVRHMPAGGPLRLAIAAIRVNAELERIGDYADAIAHRVVAVDKTGDLPAFAPLLAMFDDAIAVVAAAVEAFVALDATRAHAAMALESGVDDANREIFEELSLTNDPVDLKQRFAVLGILNRLERVADRAVNIAEDTVWVVNGEVLRHGARRNQRVLFLSPADATLGPMAEAIARAKAPLTLSFDTAGIHPQALNPAMVAFMARKGFDITRPRARGIADVGALGDYRVVVTLSEQAREECPPLPYHAIQLDWEVVDPALAADPEAALEAAYRDLDAKVDDLITALGGGTPEPKELT